MSTFIHKNLVGADAVHPAAFVQATDPGSVGANLFWLDTSTSPPTLKVRNVSNTAWTIFSAGAAGATGATGAAGTNGTTGAAGPPGSNIVSGAAPYINIQDQKASGVQGGTNTTGSFQTRTLNIITANDQFLATLASNQITLPSGTYRCDISVPGQGVSGHQARLQNITDGVTVLVGSSEFASATTTQTRSVVRGRFSLTSGKVLAIQHYTSTVSANSGYGVTSGSGSTETYTIAEFWLEGPPPPFMGSTQLTVLPSSSATRSRQDQQQHSLNTPPQ